MISAVKLIRINGYDATTVDDLCQDAGVTKGAFFHHFKSKEDAAIAATRYWTEWTGGTFANAPYHQHEDPLDQIIGYLDFRAEIIRGRNISEFTCLLGTTVQECFESHPALRAACDIAILSHADKVRDMIEAAIQRHAPKATWSADALALHTQAVIQGAFVLAKARNDPQVAIDSIIHLRRYFELLFHYAKEE